MGEQDTHSWLIAGEGGGGGSLQRKEQHGQLSWHPVLAMIGKEAPVPAEHRHPTCLHHSHLGEQAARRGRQQMECWGS